MSLLKSIKLKNGETIAYIDLEDKVILYHKSLLFNKKGSKEKTFKNMLAMVLWVEKNIGEFPDDF